MLHEHPHVTNVETAAPQSDLTGTGETNGPRILGEEQERKQLFTARTAEHKVTDLERRRKQQKGCAWTKITPASSGPEGKTKNTAVITPTFAVRKTFPERQPQPTGREPPHRTLEYV